MQLNFVADREIDTIEAVGEVLTELGLPCDELIECARSEDCKIQLRKQTEKAVELGLFGAPTFLVAKEMFWGNDRLEDALAMAAQRGRAVR